MSRFHVDTFASFPQASHVLYVSLKCAIVGFFRVGYVVKVADVTGCVCHCWRGLFCATRCSRFYTRGMEFLAVEDVVYMRSVFRKVRLLVVALVTAF
jgi:hypothetical protein